MYKLYKTIDGNDAASLISEDGKQISFLFVQSNPDYQEYLKWLEEGNIPEPADELPQE